MTEGSSGRRSIYELPEEITDGYARGRRVVLKACSSQSAVQSLQANFTSVNQQDSHTFREMNSHDFLVFNDDLIQMPM